MKKLLLIAPFLLLSILFGQISENKPLPPETPAVSNGIVFRDAQGNILSESQKDSIVENTNLQALRRFDDELNNTEYILFEYYEDLRGFIADDTIDNLIQKTMSFSCTKSLVSYDWVYPNYNDAVGAFKFSSDKSFNYSTTLFGGATRDGTWKALDNCSFELSYTNGDTKVITISNDNTFQIGSTTYYAY